MEKAEKISKIIMFSLFGLNIIYAVYVSLFDAYDQQISFGLTKLMLVVSITHAIIFFINKKEKAFTKNLLWLPIVLITVFVYKQYLDKKHDEMAENLNKNYQEKSK